MIKSTCLIGSLFIIGGIGITSCASKPHFQSDPLFFTTIFDNDAKLFRFEMTRVPVYLSEKDLSATKLRKQARARAANKRHTRAGYKENRLLQELNRELKRKLEETGFCREGYLRLEQNIETTRAYVRGECYDLATSDDRRKFPNRTILNESALNF